MLVGADTTRGEPTEEVPQSLAEIARGAGVSHAACRATRRAATGAGRDAGDGYCYYREGAGGGAANATAAAAAALATGGAGAGQAAVTSAGRYAAGGGKGGGCQGSDGAEARPA